MPDPDHDPAPFFDDVSAPSMSARWVRASDGVRLRLAHLAPDGARGTVLLFPGRTEYVEKYAPTAADLATAGLATLTVDWRGQGLSDRLTSDALSGHVDDFADYQHDVGALMAAAGDLDLPRPWYLLAHSMGGAIGLRALLNGLPVERAAFSSPMWGITIAATMRPLALVLTWAASRTRFATAYAPGTRNKAYPNDTAFDQNLLTTDPDNFAWLAAQTAAHPDLALGGPSLQWLHAALTENRALARMPSPDVPCLCVLGAEERIVDPGSIQRRMRSWPGGELMTVPEARHETLMERLEIRDRVMAAILAHFDA